MKNLPVIRSPDATRWLRVLVLSCGLLAVRAPAATLTTLYSFPESPNGLSHPTALVQGGDGSLYGTNAYGGPHGNGTVFKLTTGGVFTLLHGFSGRDADVSGVNNDGAFPLGNLALGADGSLYGTAQEAGRHDNGTVFKVTPGGEFTTLHTFFEYSGGDAPVGGLLLGQDGNFYGTTTLGGQDGNGAVFKMTPDGVTTPFFSFGNAEAANARASLVQDSGGNFYGTTRGGGRNYAGTVFKLAADGTFTRLHSFGGSLDGQTNSDGFHPESALVSGNDGNLYGTTPIGGKYGYGTVFRITPDGVFRTLHQFNPDNGDGACPAAGLRLAKDGYFYGTTEFGGANDTGTIFRINAAGAETVFYSFGALGSDDTNADGAFPLSSLIEGKDGIFYGTTYDGGASGYGTVFTIDILPRIDNPGVVSGNIDTPFDYQITATNNPTRFGATGLPPGLHIDAATGIISGTSSKANNYHLTITAANALGKTTAALVIAIRIAPPVITSPLSIDVTAGTNFRYQITATNNATKFGAQSLSRESPIININKSTGQFIGYTPYAGTFQIWLKASNPGGVGEDVLTITAH